MRVKPIKTEIFKENDDLFDFVVRHVGRVPDKSVIVITSKIVALSEGRVHEILDEHTKEKLIKSESQWAMKTKYTWLTIKDDMVMSSAGIDKSNADGKLILLPKDSFHTARTIRKRLQKHYGVRNLGILITDSRLYPLRAGVVGVALGYAGFKGIYDYRGEKDIFGRVMRIEQTDVADSLATAAILVMGEGAEQQPLAVIEGAPVEFTERSPSRYELHVDPKEDVYQPLFQNIRRIKLNTRKGRKSYK